MYMQKKRQKHKSSKYCERIPLPRLFNTLKIHKFVKKKLIDLCFEVYRYKHYEQ